MGSEQEMQEYEDAKIRCDELADWLKSKGIKKIENESDIGLISLIVLNSTHGLFPIITEIDLFHMCHACYFAGYKRASEDAQLERLLK